MNRLFITGNLTKDPELRTTTSGVSVCTFTVAVNRRQTAQQRQSGQQAEADFFRVTAWRELGENCAKGLIKGKKVCVIGPVSISTYQGQDGKTYSNLEVQAQDVEFLSPAGQTENNAPAPPKPAVDPQSGFQQVAMTEDELPF